MDLVTNHQLWGKNGKVIKKRLGRRTERSNKARQDEKNRYSMEKKLIQREILTHHEAVHH